MNTRLSLLAGAALAVLGFAAPASALTFTQTATFGPALTDYNGTGPGASSIMLFDTNGGTLNSITFSSSYGFNSTITVMNTAQSSSSGSAFTQSAAQFSAGTTAATGVLNNMVNTAGDALIGSSELNPAAFFENGTTRGYSGLAPGSSTTLQSNSATQTNAAITDTTASDLAAFSNAGGGNLAVLFETITGTALTNRGGNTSASQSTTATGTLTITYNYDLPPAPPPATPVPEPASMLVLGAGLVGLGLVRRSRA